MENKFYDKVYGANKNFLTVPSINGHLNLKFLFAELAGISIKNHGI